MKDAIKAGLYVAGALGAALAPQRGFAEGCPAPKTANDIVACAIQRGPEVMRSQGEAAYSNTQVEAAGQFENPELEADYARAGGESETSLSLQMPVRSLLTRSTKQDSAVAAKEASEAAFEGTKAQAKIQAILNLYRLKQIGREKSLIDESLQTFNKLTRQYAARPQLAPEQEIALSVFRVAVNDYQLQKASLQEEENRLQTWFSSNTGFSLDQVRQALPGDLKSWPSPSASSRVAPAPELKGAKAELLRARGDQRLARQESWPDLKIGPSLRMTNTPTGRTSTWGAALSLPLPLFSLNGGNRASAAQAVSNAEVNVRLIENEVEVRKRELMASYEGATEALRESISLDEVHKKHERLEALFLRGVVNSSLVIESHRQLVDLERSKNEKELTALQSLWSLRALNGRIFEESL